MTRFLLRSSPSKLRPKNQKSPGMLLPLGLPWQVTELRTLLHSLVPAAKMRPPLMRRVEIKCGEPAGALRFWLFLR